MTVYHAHCQLEISSVVMALSLSLALFLPPLCLPLRNAADSSGSYPDLKKAPLASFRFLQLAGCEDALSSAAPPSLPSAPGYSPHSQEQMPRMSFRGASLMHAGREDTIHDAPVQIACPFPDLASALQSRCDDNLVFPPLPPLALPPSGQPADNVV
jgi:hypothetical protein